MKKSFISLGPVMVYIDRAFFAKLQFITPVTAIFYAQLN